MTQENPINAEQLYAIDANPVFLAQSRVQDDGSIIMKWKTIKGIRFTISQVY